MSALTTTHSLAQHAITHWQAKQGTLGVVGRTFGSKHPKHTVGERLSKASSDMNTLSAKFKARNLLTDNKSHTIHKTEFCTVPQVLHKYISDMKEYLT